MTEDNAHRVLHIFSHFKSRPGEVLMANAFVAVGHRRHWPMSDLQSGLEEALRSGWVEEAKNGWRLTIDGFEESAKERIG